MTDMVTVLLDVEVALHQAIERWGSDVPQDVLVKLSKALALASQNPEMAEEIILSVSEFVGNP